MVRPWSCRPSSRIHDNSHDSLLHRLQAAPQIYRNTSLGVSLYATLKEFVEEKKISPAMAIRMMAIVRPNPRHCPLHTSSALNPSICLLSPRSTPPDALGARWPS